MTVQGKGGNRTTANPIYQTWIGMYVVRAALNPRLSGTWTLAGILRGSCYSASAEMQDVFPELVMVRGWVVSADFVDDPECTMLDPGDGHYWLETTDGEIVDPTALQFSRIGRYFPFDESQSHLLPTGKCPNCGDYCYDGKDLCSDNCARSYAAYCMAASA